MKNSAYSNSNSSEKNKLVLLLVIVFVFLLVTVSLLALKKNKSADKMTDRGQGGYTSVTQPPVNESSPTYRMRLNNPNPTLKAGSKYKVNVQLESPDADLTGVSLNVTYDPKAIKIESMSSGDVWANANELRKYDPNKAQPGSATYILGKGFGAQPNSNLNVAVIEFTVLASGMTQSTLALAPDSHAVKAGVSGNMRLFVEPLMLELNK